MKKIVLSTICMIFLLGLVGCGEERHKENIEEIYKDYWNYSLGDYEYTYEVNDDNGSNSSGGLITSVWYDYTFTFKDIDGDLRNIKINNYNITDFNVKILNAANKFLKEDVEELFKSRNIKEVEGIEPVYNSIFCDVNVIDKDIDLYDNRNGLKFNKLSLNTLNENNINVKIEIQIKLDGNISDYPNLKQKIIDDVKFIFENYEYSNINFEFEIVELPDKYNRTTYYLSYDGTNYNWQESID